MITFRSFNKWRLLLFAYFYSCIVLGHLLFLYTVLFYYHASVLPVTLLAFQAFLQPLQGIGPPVYHQRVPILDLCFPGW